MDESTQTNSQDNGLIHIYTGDGKGKTTASVGLICRAAGAGKRALLVQFLKGRDTGELASLRALGVTVMRGEIRKFTSVMNEVELAQCRQEQERWFRAAGENMGGYDLVVMDEILVAVSLGMVEEGLVEQLVRNKPEATELVLTGRNAPETLIALADYVSEVRCVKHPFASDVKARKGIEF